MVKRTLLVAALVGTVFSLGALRAAAADEDQRGLTDQQFVTQASAAGLAEVNLARMALEQSNNADVKKFAQHLIDNHTKANTELNSLADKHRILPAQSMDAQHQQLMQRLGQLRGEAFDRAFVDAMVKDHKDAISLFERESKDGQDKDLKKFASDTLSTLKDHLSMAEKAAGHEKEGSRDREETGTTKERSKGSTDTDTDKDKTKERSKESTDKEKGSSDKDKSKGSSDKEKDSKDKDGKER
jgi:putative membrane protein